MTTGAPAALLGVGAHPRHRGAQHAGVGALGGAEGVGGQGRLEVGQRVHRGVAEQHRARRRRRPRCAGAARPARAGRTANPSRMAESWLPLLTHHLGAGVDEPQHGLREQLDGLGRGHRAVVDVAADEHGVDPLGAHDLDEVVEVGGLGAEQPHLVERASQVPVGGVDQPHGTHATSGVRHHP